MRYLKVYEDIVDGYIKSDYETKNDALKQDVNDLFQQYSTYLIDDGFDYDIRITGFQSNQSLQLSIFKPNPNTRDYMNSRLYIKWGDVKGDIIQICHLLSNEYKITNIKLNERVLDETNRRNIGYDYKLQTILNDEIKDDKIYDYIQIDIEAFSKPEFVYKKKGLIDKFKDIFKK